MNSNFKNMVEYYGISEYIPDNIKSFKEVVIHERIKIPENKPKAKDLVKLSIFPKITNSRLVATGIGTSLEGLELTGYKYVSELSVKVRASYVGILEDKGIFTVSSILKQSSSVILPKDFICYNHIQPSVFVEDIYGELETEEYLLLTTTLLVMIEIED